MKTVLELRCEPLPLVRIGLVGLGRRGMKTLERYAHIGGAVINCLADTDPARLEEAGEKLARSGRPQALALSGADAWQEVCRRADVDLVYICTDWATHCEMAVEAMRCGKHVAVEVPAATSIDECHLLVETAEATRRHCFMTENCCYDHFALATLEMVREGLLGEVTHCEELMCTTCAATSDWRPAAPWPPTGWSGVAPVTTAIRIPRTASGP